MKLRGWIEASQLLDTFGVSPKIERPSIWITFCTGVTSDLRPPWLFIEGQTIGSLKMPTCQQTVEYLAHQPTDGRPSGARAMDAKRQRQRRCIVSKDPGSPKDCEKPSSEPKLVNHVYLRGLENMAGMIKWFFRWFLGSNHLASPNI